MYFKSRKLIKSVQEILKMFRLIPQIYVDFKGTTSNAQLFKFVQMFIKLSMQGKVSLNFLEVNLCFVFKNQLVHEIIFTSRCDRQVVDVFLL